MESNLNQRSIAAYAGAFAEEVLHRAYASAPHLNGDELLVLCDIRQVNLQVIRLLHEKWTEEARRMRSPYFDYESAEVHRAFSEFMNILSQHIRISRDDLRPILEAAVQKSLLLVFSPYEFYLQEIERSPEGRVGIGQLKNLQKYVKVNRNLLQALIVRFETAGLEQAPAAEALRLFNEVCEATGETPDDTEPYRSDFSAILPLELSQIYGDSGPDDIPAEAPAAPAGDESPDNLNLRFRGEKKALHETLGGGKRATLADMHQKMSLDGGLDKAININQRFMFVRELFGGRREEYDQTVAFLDACGDRQEAFVYLQANYFDKGLWDPEKEEVAEFLEILEHRFPA
jgi:hypothetical protein